MIIIQLDSEQLFAIIQKAVSKAINESPQSHAATPEADELLTIKQAAQLLCLSVPTIYSLVSRAEIPVNKRGKRLYFSKAELTAWIKAGRKKTTAETAAEAEQYLKNKKA
ncbi:MAG TPA: helix-turn-helix domain-containing protein [Bacteroidia bacterium]|nr:helix-turn-helix domain-containing protein [Bacteroidia bacterium]